MSATKLPVYLALTAQRKQISSEKMGKKNYINPEPVFLPCINNPSLNSFSHINNYIYKKPQVRRLLYHYSLKNHSKNSDKSLLSK